MNTEKREGEWGGIFEAHGFLLDLKDLALLNLFDHHICSLLESCGARPCEHTWSKSKKKKQNKKRFLKIIPELLTLA